MESAPLLNKGSGIRVRLVRESDTERLQEIYMQAMLYASSSPAHVAMKSLPRRKSFAIVLCGLLILGLILLYPPSTRLAGAALTFCNLILFIAWRQIMWLWFKTYCQDVVDTDLSNLEEHYSTKPSAFWVAEIGEGKAAGTILGYVALVADSKDPTTGEVKRMVVDPTYQNHGVGRLLMKTLLDHAKTIGLSTMTLSTTMFHTGAMRMYKRLGFTKDKQVWIDVTILGFTLDQVYIQFFSLNL